MSQGPATPSYILRGHVSSIHALVFFASNAFLASGDSDGWLVIWSLSTKRPVAVWKAHDGGISGIRYRASLGLITHGRDHKLRVWQLRLDDESTLNTTLPVDGAAADDSTRPWLLHSLSISALNFCTFAICNVPPKDGIDLSGYLIATPNGLDSGGIDVFQLPTERRVFQLRSSTDINTGMVMAVTLFYADRSDYLYLVSGYEDGQVMVHVYDGELGSARSKWHRILICKLHTQPVLSLDLAPSQDYFITSSADSTIAKFALPSLSSAEITNQPQKSVNTKHAGQQGLSIRSDGKIFATAGWDARIRVYSTKTMKELAVLKWHKEGCYSTAFAVIDSESGEGTAVPTSETAIVKSALDVIKEERAMKAQKTHWLAAGAKDGKISLWDIY